MIAVYNIIKFKSQVQVQAKIPIAKIPIAKIPNSKVKFKFKFKNNYKFKFRKSENPKINYKTFVNLVPS
jgi:hypothetical protein